ncbi:MAG: PASTA domain-containing protein, partial [Ruthenibacterium sp.]
DLLRVTVIEQSNNSYESGIIFKQSPAAGEELTKGTAVTLYVSSGSGADTPDTADNTDNADAESAIEKNPKILIPDVTGMDSDTAQATLNLMGFTVTTEIEENNEVTSGEVIRTKPATGAVVMQGAAVKIFLAMPSKTEKLVTVPDVSKQTLEAAKQNLSYLGLIVNRVTYTESSTTPHLVLSQDVAAGTAVKVGTTINLVVSKSISAIYPSQIILKTTAKTIAIGEKFGLGTIFIPDNATVKNITWTSNNDNVAVVSSDGIVTGISAGTAVILATDAAKHTSTCAVTVLAPPPPAPAPAPAPTPTPPKPAPIPMKDVALSAIYAECKLQSTIYLSASPIPANTTDTVTYTWQTSDPDVAVVQGTGSSIAIYGNSAGEVFITVTANGFSESCYVVVQPPVIYAAEDAED